MKKHNKYNIRKPIAEKFLNYAEKHIKTIIIIFIAAIIFTPIIVKHCYCSNANRTFSAEIMLTYIESAIMGSATFFAAIIALFVGQHSSKLQEKLYVFEHMNKIRPFFYLTVEKNQNNTYNLKLKNMSENFAKDIYLYEGIQFSNFINKSKTENRCMAVDNENVENGKDDEDIIHITKSDCSGLENGYPKEILVGFSDIDDNSYQQIFKKEAETYVK